LEAAQRYTDADDAAREMMYLRGSAQVANWLGFKSWQEASTNLEVRSWAQAVASRMLPDDLHELFWSFTCSTIRRSACNS